MESTTYLVNQLINNPLTTPSGQIISLQTGDDFSWDPNRLCIFYNPKDNNSAQLLLHELGHALLGHSVYKHDIELIAIERAAWDQALKISTDYKVKISDELI